MPSPASTRHPVDVVARSPAGPPPAIPMAAAMLASIPTKDELYDYAARAYDPESRVPLVEAVLNKVGADKYLDEKQALTTYELAPNTRRSTVPVSLRPTHAAQPCP